MSTKGRRFAAIPLDLEEASKLASSGRTARDRAILVMLWRTGIRANELCSLDVDHVRFQEDGSATVKVANPKNISRGAPQRVLGVGKRASDVFRVWLRKRGSDDGPFFRTHQGNRLCTSQIRRTVTLAGERCKLGRRVHPHALRHSFAAGLYDEGIGMNHIKAALGHAHLNTTDRYLRNIGCDEIVDITSRREW